ncbi:MAG TPA: hypothetical protein G4N95_08320 [Anaerolineae bacterium]|nr:hypothetical protein [Anaerolineae bacterium]
MKKLIRQTYVLTSLLILILILLSACSSRQVKLDWQDTFTEPKTESKTGFFNVEAAIDTIEVNTLMDISAGRGEYQVIDPAGTVVLSGKLQAGDTLNETLPLIGIKGSWTFYIFIEDAVGKYHFTINVK